MGVFKKILYDIRRSRATALYAYHGAEYDVVNRGGSNGYHDYSLAGYMGYGLEPTTVVNTNHYYHLYHDEQEDNVEVVPPPPVAAGRIAVGDTNGHDVQVMISHKEQPVPMLTLPQIDLKCTDESQQQSTDGECNSWHQLVFGELVIRISGVFGFDLVACGGLLMLHCMHGVW